MSAVHVEDEVQGVQGSRLLGFDFILNGVRHQGNQAGRNLYNVHFLQVTLNLTHCYAPCVQRLNLVLKAAPTSLVLGDNLRLERTDPVAGDFNG
jgi:hypothetical protein